VRFGHEPHLRWALRNGRSRHCPTGDAPCPADGPIADRFAAATSIMTGAQSTPVNPNAAFDAVVYVDTVPPWHHLLDRRG
jgi:hypothetical protein